ncbi:MAG: Mfa1 fimbrilin C-terminal domain-containing protein [Bacteroides sp.]|nr:Mfa1 fimbrilin C-terminal domain-containing protein [Bacteroides sp.]
MMKSFSKLMFAALLATGFWACSDEVDVPDNGGTETTDKVYMSFDLQLPTATRSATDDPSQDDNGDTNSDANPDSEEGSDAENAVSSAVVVLATLENEKYTYFAESTGSTLISGAGTNYTVTFKSDALLSKAGETVYVFVFCNYPSNFDFTKIFTENEASTALTDDKLEDAGGIAHAKNFWMSNAAITSATLPSETDLLKYNSSTNPCSLGTVKVERAAARFDYRPYGVADNGNKTNKYTLEKDANDEPTVQVELTDIALVNLSKSFYHLRRVAGQKANTTDPLYDDTNVTICGAEASNNFVVDTDASSKMSSTGSDNFLYHFDAEDDAEVVNYGSLWKSLSTTTLSSLTTDDNWEDTDSNNSKIDGFKVWRYATENTLPSVNSQTKSQSTGIIFRGVLNDLKTASDNRLSGDKAYVFGNVLYGTWAQVQSKVNAIADTETDASLLDMKAAYKSVAATITTGQTEPTLANAALYGFTVYEKDSEDNTFYTYYFYKNRHNDNGNANSMGIMEFAVVRNNVYKLTVESISLFGHPADPEGDPTPDNPDDPDEEKKVYFRVAVQVLPWVVRVNDIEF